MKRLLYILIIIAVCSCKQNNGTEKYQTDRNKIINVREKVKEIEITDVLIGGIAQTYLIDDYLIIGDYQSQDKLIHIFDKNAFNYLTSIAYKGQGPNEIANMGHIGVNEKEHLFYVSDHGKQTIFAFHLDSLLTDHTYTPKVKMKMNENQFPDRYTYVSDTLCIGLVIEPIGNADYKPVVAKWNMNTGEINTMKYEHPDIDKKRITFAVSVDHNMYVECHSYHDLMTICDLTGKLKYNIYGKNWGERRNSNVRYYGSVAICGDKIVTLYAGKESSDGNKGQNIYSTKFNVFNIEGDYLYTLETDYRIVDFCYDYENNRIIMNLDDDIQFAYLDANDLNAI